MHVFRLIISVARRHWAYLAIYLGVLTLAAVCMGAWANGVPRDAADDEFTSDRPKVAVIDRDGTAVSQALRSFVENRGTAVHVEDSIFGLQDASAKDIASYVLIIPEGYEQELIAAARDGRDAPTMETIISYQGAQGALVDEQVNAFAGALYGFAAATNADAAQIAAWATEACSQSTPVELSAQTQDSTGIPQGYLVYAMFSGYAIFCATSIFIAVGMAPVERTEVRRRLHAAPVASLAFGLQANAACIVFGLAIWAFEAAIGIAAFSGQLSDTVPGLVGIIVAAQFVYMLFAVAVGFLLWRLKVGEEYANAIGNVFGMLFSFMGGAWMSLDMMSQEFQVVAHFTPGFWAMDAMQAAAESSSLAPDLLARVGGDLGITLLFALAVLAVGLVASRARLRERGA